MKICGAGLSYAIDLAKIMNKGMTVLLICRRNLMERFADVMTSVTFAEVGEYKTAKKNVYGRRRENEFADKGISSLAKRCREAGVEVKVQSTAIALVPALKY